MKIVSRNESTIDYPKKFGQILFCGGCNFRCGFCHNPELIFENLPELNLDEIINELKDKKEQGWYEGICLSGGEPTIYPDLLNFLKRLKSTGLKIKLDTNGTNPELLKEILNKNLVDYVAMDIKSTKKKYKEIVNVDVDINKISQSIEIVKQFPEYEFRTTVVPFLTKEDFIKIGKWISASGKVTNYSIQQFVPKKCLDKEFEKLVPKSDEEIKEIEEIMKEFVENVVVK